MLSSGLPKILLSFLFSISLLLLAKPGHAQQKPKPGDIVVNGRVLDSVSITGIEDVLIINKKSNKMSTTDKEGYFYCVAHPTDTLVIYMLGYFPRVVPVPELNLSRQIHLFYMKRNMGEIREIEITAQRIKKTEEYQFPFNQAPATAESPITLLYEQLSRRYKQYRKVEELEKKKYYEQLRQARLNQKVILQITDLKEEEVEDFLKFAYFPDDFLETASQYELLVSIKKKYMAYKNR